MHRLRRQIFLGNSAGELSEHMIEKTNCYEKAIVFYKHEKNLTHVVDCEHECLTNVNSGNTAYLSYFLNTKFQITQAF